MYNFPDIKKYLLYFVAFLPLMGRIDVVLYKGQFGVAIPYSIIIFISIVFIPTLLSNWVTDKGQKIVELFVAARWFLIPLIAVVLMRYLWLTYHPRSFHGFMPNRTTLYALHTLVLFMIGIIIGTDKFFKDNFRKIFFLFLLFHSLVIYVCLLADISLSTVPTRAASFERDPNNTAITVIVLTIGAVNWNKNSPWNYFVFAMAGFDIYLTLSVGGASIFILVYLVYMIINLVRGGLRLDQLLAIFAATLLLIILLVPALSYILESSDVYANEKTRNRINSIVEIASGDFTSVTEHERMHIVWQFWSDIVDNPIVGNGVGYYRVGEAPHNMYIMMWAEMGIGGLLIYLLFLLGAFNFFYRFRNIQGMVYMMTLCIASMYSHQILYRPHLIFIIVVLAVIAYQKYYESIDDRDNEIYSPAETFSLKPF